MNNKFSLLKIEAKFIMAKGLHLNIKIEMGRIIHLSLQELSLFSKVKVAT